MVTVLLREVSQKCPKTSGLGLDLFAQIQSNPDENVPHFFFFFFWGGVWDDL